MKRTVSTVYFSPGSTTARVAHTFTEALCNEARIIDLLKESISKDIVLAPNDLLIVAMPVFSGRIPSVCVAPLQQIKGKNTPAVIFAVYGNRAYEDALLELYGLLEQNGFVPIAAGAVPARHSIFPKVAHNRPDLKDLEEIRSFAQRCLEKMERTECSAVTVPGKHPYREIASIPLAPTGKPSICAKCGVCAKICPAQAIPSGHPCRTNRDKCISCTACIYHCPHNARAFHGLKYRLASMARIHPWNLSCNMVRLVYLKWVHKT